MPETTEHHQAHPAAPATEHQAHNLDTAAELTAHDVAVEEQHGAGHHGLLLGRYLEHPPEPPHLIQMWYGMEQSKLTTEYAKEHGLKEKPDVVENWLDKDSHGEWEQVEGRSPTLVQVLHIGPETKALPLIGYSPWENHAYLALAMIVLVGIFYVATSSFRRDRIAAMRRPSRSQVFIEWVVGTFDEFCRGLLGDHQGRKYMPFIGTLFCLILVGNLMGLVPLLKAPTSSIVITFSLAICTFIIVQGTAWTKLGPVSYIHHLMGSPKDALGWFLSPLFLLLEVIADFVAKPMSLALRLFGNIFGKDILLGAFLAMGISLMQVIFKPLGEYVGLPLTYPFYFLGLLLSTIQALVFALLSTIYIALVLPHDHDHEEDHGHGAEGHGHTEHAPAH